jgi:aspartyl-tRNA(Asn)/glutamyl-tRNA(Gln) amidotransferase subunit B
MRAFLAECRESLPELPDAKRRRYEAELGLSAYNAAVLTAEVETARWFERLLAATGKSGPRSAAPPPTGSSRICSARSIASVGPSRTARSARTGRLSCCVSSPTARSPARLSKQVFEIMLESGQGPAQIVEERGLKQTSDTGAIEAEIQKVMAANADKVAEYRGGKDKLFGFFVGQTMKAMAGKANPAVVNDLLKKALG